MPQSQGYSNFNPYQYNPFLSQGQRNVPQQPFGSNIMPSTQNFQPQSGGFGQNALQGGVQGAVASGGNPLVAAGSAVLSGLGSLADTTADKDERYSFGMKRKLMDDAVWNPNPLSIL